MVHYISERFGHGLRAIQGRLPRLVRRHPPERGRDGPGVRPPARRQVRHAAPLRERRLGDLLHARPARAAVQARHPDGARPGRRGARPRARRDPGWRVRRRRRRCRHDSSARRGRCSSAPGGRPARSRGTTASDAAHRRGGRRGGGPKRRTLSRSGRSTRPASASSRTRSEEPACSRGIVEHYGDHDFVGPLVDAGREDRRGPAAGGRRARAHAVDQPGLDGVLQGHPRADDPQRGRVSPHPLAPRCCADAAHVLAEAAVAAGAPDGFIQVVDEPSVPLIEALMSRRRDRRDPRHRRRGVVRAAYRSGNPAIGVGPGNVPGARRRDRRPRAAAALPGRQEGVRQLGAVHQRVGRDRRGAVADALPARARAATARTCSATDERDRVRDALFPDGRFDTALVGKDAATIAAAAGVRVPPRTRVLVAPFDLVVAEEPLAHEKLCPVLGLRARARRRARDRRGAGRAADRRRRPLGGDPQQRPAHVMEYAAAVACCG